MFYTLPGFWTDQSVDCSKYSQSSTPIYPQQHRFWHSIFGKGIIKSIDGQKHDSKAKIYFYEKGEKNLLLKYAKLQIIDAE